MVKLEIEAAAFLCGAVSGVHDLGGLVSQLEVGSGLTVVSDGLHEVLQLAHIAAGVVFIDEDLLPAGRRFHLLGEIDVSFSLFLWPFTCDCFMFLSDGASLCKICQGPGSMEKQSCVYF